MSVSNYFTLLILENFRRSQGAGAPLAPSGSASVYIYSFLFFYFFYLWRMEVYEGAHFPLGPPKGEGFPIIWIWLIKKLQAVTLFIIIKNTSSILRDQRWLNWMWFQTKLNVIPKYRGQINILAIIKFVAVIIYIFLKRK